MARAISRFVTPFGAYYLSIFFPGFRIFAEFATPPRHCTGRLAQCCRGLAEATNHKMRSLILRLHRMRQTFHCFLIASKEPPPSLNGSGHCVICRLTKIDFFTDLCICSVVKLRSKACVQLIIYDLSILYFMRISEIDGSASSHAERFPWRHFAHSAFSMPCMKLSKWDWNIGVLRFQ